MTLCCKFDNKDFFLLLSPSMGTLYLQIIVVEDLRDFQVCKSGSKPAAAERIFREFLNGNPFTHADRTKWKNYMSAAYINSIQSSFE